MLRHAGASTLFEALAEARAVLSPDAPWEVDIVPLPGGIDTDPTARLACALISADGLVLHADAVSRAPSGTDEIAALIADAVHQLIEQIDRRPPAVHVRYAGVADALRELLRDAGITVQFERDLAGLREMAELLVQRMAELDERPPLISSPQTWAAWEWPKEMIAELFAAATAFYVARPWERVDNEQLIRLNVPGGRAWTAQVLGAGGLEFGLTLYADPADVSHLLTEKGPGQAFRAMRSAVLSLTFNARRELPKPMQREVAAAGWTVAGVDAYPSLFALNTPAGGLTREQAADLAASLRTVARFAAAMAEALASAGPASAPIPWRDADSGIDVLCDPPVDAEAEYLWPVPEPLAPGLADGPNADPRAVLGADADPEALTEREHEVAHRFEGYLRDAGAPDRRAARDAGNVRLFLDFLVHVQGVGLAAVTEYDLRVFLYDWFPRKVLASRGAALTVRTSLRRFFSFAADCEGIACPWSAALLRDRERFEERWDGFPGGHWWDEEVRAWQGVLYADLEARAMLPARTLADGAEWGASMGIEEAHLHGLLQRAWLEWRDEAIRGGLTDPASLRPALTSRQREWELRPQRELGGRSPSDVIADERARRG